MTAAQRRGLNDAVTRMWSFLAPAYDLPFLQQWVYRPFDDGALDAVVTTSAFHFFDQPAALREFHRVLRPGGLVAVSALSARQRRLQASSSSRWKPQHNASPAEMRHLFEGAGLVISDQHRIPRPAWTRIVSDLITVGTKS